MKTKLGNGHSIYHSVAEVKIVWLLHNNFENADLGEPIVKVKEVP